MRVGCRARPLHAARRATRPRRTEERCELRRLIARRRARVDDVTRRAVRRGQYADPEVFTNDIIFVGDDANRRLIQTLISSAALLSGPLIAILN